MLHVVENTVEQRGTTGARLQAPDFASGAEAIARGAQNLGQGIQQASENLDKIGEEYDTAAVKQADAEDMKAIGQIRADVLSSKGFDTQNAIAEARPKIEAIRAARMAQLSTKRQRDMYGDVFDARNVQVEDSFASHSAAQIMQASQEAAQNRADSAADFAVSSFGTKDFDLNIGTALNEVAAANQGMGADTIGRKQAQLRSSIIGRAISAQAADPDQAEHAQLAIEQYSKNGLLPEDEEKLRRQVNPILNENRRDADAGWALTSAPVPGSPTAPQGQGYVPDHPADSAQTPPRPAIHTIVDQPEPVIKPVSAADPLRGKGHITDNAAAHRARGSGNALDIAAPQGTAIYPPMSGKVIKSWWDQKGGWSVLVEHPNGYVTGYAHLRSKSPFDEGQHVEPDTPIGSVGMTGDATGPHVHYTVRQSAGGAKVDPASAMWTAQGTVKPDSVSWKEGEPQVYQAQDMNLDRALSRLHDRATAENWSDYRYNQAVDRVRQVAGVQQEMYNKQQEDQYDEAMKAAVSLGDKFTSISQIPQFSTLKGTNQRTLQDMADANRKAAAGDQVKANGDRFLMLMGMGESPEFRQQFLSVDLGAEKDITAGERARLFERQIKLKQEPNGALAANLDTVNAFANRYLPAQRGVGVDQALMLKRRAFSDQMSAAIERQQNALGRPLTSREQDDMARALTVKVVRPGGDAIGAELFTKGAGGGQIDYVTEFNRIAPDIRQSIANQLAARGRPSTMRDVVAEWLRSRTR